jgi:hypothetical protein
VEPSFPAEEVGIARTVKKFKLEQKQSGYRYRNG